MVTNTVFSLCCYSSYFQFISFKLPCSG